MLGDLAKLSVAIALKSCPKSKKSLDLVTLLCIYAQVYFQRRRNEEG